jgi:hypothetical protein
VLFLWVLIVVVIMSVGATLLTKGTVALMGKFGGQTIHNLHTSAEFIVARHTVPPAWLEKLGRRLDGLRPGCADARRAAAHRGRAQRACLRQLDKLIAHFKKTSLVVDEEARSLLVSELIRVYDEWESWDWDRMSSRGP